MLNKLAKSRLESEGTVKPEAEREEQEQFGSMVVIVRTVSRVEIGEVGEIFKQVGSEMEVLRKNMMVMEVEMN